MITRRQSLKRLVGVAAATLTVPMINRGWFQVFAESATTYSARAIDLVQRSTVVDMLNPFTLLGVLAPFKADKRPTWFTNPETFTSADFQRFKDSGTDVMHIGVGTVGPNSYDQVMWFLGLWNGFIAHHGEHLMRGTTRQASTLRKDPAKSALSLVCRTPSIFGARTMSIVSINSGNACRCSRIIAVTQSATEARSDATMESVTSALR
jgi:membrane dipeptidase